MTPSPEQPEHEEARRLAIEAGWRVTRMPVVGYLVECPSCGFEFNEEHEDEGGGWSCPVCAEIGLRALLSKAEQERDQARKGVAAGYGLMGQWRKREAEMKTRAEAAERELERLRGLLAECAPVLRRHDALALVGKVDRALSADTQREP